MLDQAAVDRGSWTLASELSGSAGANAHETRDPEQVFSRILDPRWAEVALHHLRDQADFLEKRAKLNKPCFQGGQTTEADESELTFPPPPAFDPRGFLDAATSERFERPLKFSAPADSVALLPPRVKILASHAEKLQLFKDLASGRLLPFKASPDRIPHAAGLFAVTKDLQQDRLVLDARPANTPEVRPAFWSSTLASSAVLGQIVLRPNERLSISTADLKDFFYLFKIGEERLERNLLQGALSREEARYVFGQGLLLSRRCPWSRPCGVGHFGNGGQWGM